MQNLYSPPLHLRNLQPTPLCVLTAYAEATERSILHGTPSTVASSSKPNTELRGRISPMPSPGRAFAPSLVPAWLFLFVYFSRLACPGNPKSYTLLTIYLPYSKECQAVSEVLDRLASLIVLQFDK